MVLDAMDTVDGALFFSNGNNSRAGYALGDRHLNFYAMGSMGQCASLAAGFSSMTDRPTAALDGDGSAAMGLAGFPLVTNTARRPFLHVVVNNGLYETTGGQRVPIPAELLAATAHGSGYDQVTIARDERELSSSLRDALMGTKLAFIQAMVTVDKNSRQYPRVPFHPKDIATRFAAAVAEGSAPQRRHPF